jgi:hypothetical protein
MAGVPPYWLCAPQDDFGVPGVIKRMVLQGKVKRSGIPGVRLQSKTYSSPSCVQPSAEIVPGSLAEFVQ